MKKSNLIIWGFLKKIIIGLCFIIFFYFFIGAPMIISGSSMEPNFHDKNAALINKFWYLFKKPSRGEVVVFRFPGTRTDLYVKRIIGLPGETVEIKDNNVFIDNKLLAEPYINQDTQQIVYNKTILGDNEYFILGDNRGGSNDSRTWGVLEKKFIIGKLDLVFWPLSGKQALVTPLYNL